MIYRSFLPVVLKSEYVPYWPKAFNFTVFRISGGNASGLTSCENGISIKRPSGIISHLIVPDGVCT